jgi:hypothetical protein
VRGRVRMSVHVDVDGDAEREVWGGAIRYLKTDDLETKAKQIDDIFLQEEQNQKQVDRELSLLKEDMFRESQVSQSGRALCRVLPEYALGYSGARRALPEDSVFGAPPGAIISSAPIYRTRPTERSRFPFRVGSR